MAEGWMRHLAGDRFDVFSAGTRPVGLNPNAVTAMAEIGIDISGHRSKSVGEFAGQQFDYVVTVCDSARESCPVFPGPGKRLHESFDDPAAALRDQQLAVFRKVRDQIRTYLEEFVASTQRESQVRIEIKVLGPGCDNCKRLYAEAEKAVSQISAPATLTKVEDIREIMAYRILATPALVINGEVKSAGRIPNAAEITTWLATAAIKQ